MKKNPSKEGGFIERGKMSYVVGRFRDKKRVEDGRGKGRLSRERQHRERRL